MRKRKIKCAMCGKTVVATGVRQKYCPTCAHERLLAANRTPGTTKTIRCAKCGKTVEVKKRASRAKYCPACAEEEAKAQRREWKRDAEQATGWEPEPNEAPKKKERLNGRCDVCGKEFSYIYTGYIRTRCHQHRYVKGDGQSQKKPHVSQIDEIQRAAHAAGMSYGKYRAMMEMRKMKKGA